MRLRAFLTLILFFPMLGFSQQNNCLREGPIHETILNAVANGQIEHYCDGPPLLDNRSDPNYREVRSHNAKRKHHINPNVKTSITPISNGHILIRNLPNSRVMEVLSSFNNECITYVLQPAQYPNMVNINTYPCKPRFTLLKAR